MQEETVSAVPVNAMGSGAGIASVDPLLKPSKMLRRQPKKLRDIIGPTKK